MMINKIRSIEKTFAPLLEKSRNIRVYLQFVKELIGQPQIMTSATFHRKVEIHFKFLPVEQEDLQAMHFYAWLKAKWLKRGYYEVLLELVRAGN